MAREVGGTDLGTVLRTLSELLRVDARTRSELETRQGWTVNAARLAVAAPWLVLLLLGSQSSTLRAFDSSGGVLLLAIGGAVCLVAYRMMLRIGRLPEEPAGAAMTGCCDDRLAGRYSAWSAGWGCCWRSVRRRRCDRSGSVDRIAPYLADAPRSVRPAARAAATVGPFGVAGRLLGPLGRGRGALAGPAGRRSRVGPAPARRPGRAGNRRDIEEFRIEQVVWGGIGLLAGTVGMAALTYLRGGLDPVLIAGAALIAGVGGVLGRDWWLTQQVRRRERSMLAEFPVIADLLALAVVAGEAPVDALHRVCRLTAGELTHDLGGALAEARAGAPITRALTDLAERSTLEPFAGSCRAWWSRSSAAPRWPGCYGRRPPTSASSPNARCSMPAAGRNCR